MTETLSRTSRNLTSDDEIRGKNKGSVVRANLNDPPIHLRCCIHWVFFQRMDISAVTHQVGTLRFSVDPMQSVFDPNCHSQELDNLYVADASFMQSTSAVNPSLSIRANALRVADILRQRLTSAA